MSAAGAVDDLRAATAGRWERLPTDAGPWRGFVTDTRETDALAGAVFVALRGTNFDAHAFVARAARAGAAVAIVDRPVVVPAESGLGVLQVDDTRRALADLAAAHRRTLERARVVAITGSAGKTTTKRLVDAVLGRSWRGTTSPRSFNNDIGVPLSILAARPDDDYLVLEIGANAPGEVGPLAALAEPHVAVVTSIGRAHLGGFGSLEVLADEKLAIADALSAEGFAVVHESAPRRPDRVRTLTFGEGNGAEVRLTGRGPAGPGRWWFDVGGRARFELGLPGRHNAHNAVAAVAIGRELGLADAEIASGLAAVAPEAMRFQPRLVGPVLVVNDAYNANPESMAAAMETFGEVAAGAERRIAVLGGMLELGADSDALHRELADRVADRSEADLVVLVGPECGPAFARLRSRWPMDRVTWVERVDEAPEFVAGCVRSGDAVLLKASRGHALERVEAAIERRVAGAERAGGMSSGHAAERDCSTSSSS